MDAIKKKITLLKEDNEQFQEEIERLQEKFDHFSFSTRSESGKKVLVVKDCW